MTIDHIPYENLKLVENRHGNYAWMLHQRVVSRWDPYDLNYDICSF